MPNKEAAGHVVVEVYDGNYGVCTGNWWITGLAHREGVMKTLVEKVAASFK